MKFNLKEALTAAGFIPVADPYGFAADGQIVQKTYEREVETAWHGTQRCSMTVNVRFTSDYNSLTVSYSQQGRSPFKVKSHSANRRALNAISDTLINHGFAM